jgi:hypothetical protein
MSAIPPKADIAERRCHVRFVPNADIAAQQTQSIRSLDWREAGPVRALPVAKWHDGIAQPVELRSSGQVFVQVDRFKSCLLTKTPPVQNVQPPAANLRTMLLAQRLSGTINCGDRQTDHLPNLGLA